jgi:hypothetical protein
MTETKSRKKEVWHPPSYEVEDIRAVQAISDYAANGENPPSPQDCARMINWLMFNAGALREDPFRPGQGDVRDYVLGRQSVARAFAKLQTLKAEIIKK